MDKENKIADAFNEFDSEAAELLRDLDDEDDSDYQPVAASENTPTRSLVNILACSSGIDALAPTTVMSGAVPSGDTLSSNDGDRTVPDIGTVSVPESTGSDSEASPHIPQGIPAKPADSPVHPAAEPVHEFAEDEGETAKLGDPRTSASRRPPVPPKMPSPSMSSGALPPATASIPAATRVLRENEVVLTQEALNDMLPGGKNDEARDLAYKFTDNNWYAQIFNEDYFRTIPKSSPRQTLRESKFIIDHLGIQHAARVLDLCCGYGRHTIELATHGFDMVGLDLSMVMLKKALTDAQNRGQAIKFVHGDMRKLSFKSIFDAIYCVDTSFGYFDDLSNFKVIQGVYRALKPGGVFLIETVNRDFLMNDLPLRLWWKGKECTLLEEIDMEPLSGLLKVQRSFVFDEAGRAPWEQKIQIRLYTVPEMRALLSRAGFEVIELSGDYALPGAYFGASSPKNIFVAERPAR